MKNEKRSSVTICKALSAALILLTICSAILPETVAAATKNSFVPQPNRTTDDGDFDKKFREGRDLIDRGEWNQAAEKFRAALDVSPDNKSAAAALYWLAFCYKKQNQLKEADASLDRLLEKFPASNWAADARVMKLEIAAASGRSLSRTQTFGSADGANLPPSGIPSLQTAQGLYETLTIGDNAIRETPLDRADEIKLAAFQSLRAADPQRALRALGEILKPDSKASETLKIESLHVLRRPLLSRPKTLTVNEKTVAAKEDLQTLRETLAESFKSQTNPKVRREIIYTSASFGDGSVDALKKLYYAAGQDREAKEIIINLSGDSLNFLQGFDSFAENQLYASTLNGAQSRKARLDFLLEIVRTEKDAALRRLAFTGVQRFPNWASGEVVETFARSYDSEPDEDFKISIIRAFGNTKQNGAVQKLIGIAQNDKSDKLRLEAIYALRNSQDPNALKFLESLIR